MRVSITSEDGKTILGAYADNFADAASWAWPRLQGMVAEMEQPTTLIAEVWELGTGEPDEDDEDEDTEEEPDEFAPRARKRSRLAAMFDNSSRMEIFRTKTRWTQTVMDCPCCGMPGTEVAVGEVKLEDPFLLSTLTNPLARLSVKRVKPTVSRQLLAPWYCEVCSETPDVEDYPFAEMRA
jgi:hypothetical protein